MEAFIEISIEQDIQKCFKVYGAEGTEQKIRECYQLNVGIRDAYLMVYKRILNARRMA